MKNEKKALRLAAVITVIVFSAALLFTGCEYIYDNTGNTKPTKEDNENSSGGGKGNEDKISIGFGNVGDGGGGKGSGNDTDDDKSN